MLNKLIVGRYLNLPDLFHEAAKPHDAIFPAHFVEGNSTLLNIAQSKTEGSLGAKRRISQVATGAHATKVHRTFRWLPYIKGKVTYLPYVGPDILTGRMSGCWIAVFTNQGTRYVAHIGTDDFPDTSNSIQAKNAWRNAEANQGFTLVNAFNPVGPDLPGSALQKRGKAQEVYAAVETAGGGGFFTVVLGNPAHNPGPGPRKIYHVVAMPPKTVIRFLGE